ncbi:hypothetical protein CW304_18845 [Bacillus sp. UFRGS-B20]|nr:hypothetical protein CW304_18845 [Bacillus sp. UFRGS-B20]
MRVPLELISALPDTSLAVALVSTVILKLVSVRTIQLASCLSVGFHIHKYSCVVFRVIRCVSNGFTARLLRIFKL